MRTRILGNVIGCVVASYAAISVAETSAQEYSLDIPHKPVAAMLQDLSIQTGISVSMIVDDVDHRNLRVGPLKGRYTVDAALSELLADTDLTYTRVNGSMVVVTARNSNGAGGASTTAQAKAKLHLLADTQFVNAEANSAGAEATGAGAKNSSAEAKSPRMEEVVVTATKRAENILEVPLSIAAISAGEINKRGLVSAEDYLRGIPGANQVTDAFGGGSIVIRGMETSAANQNFSSGPTTATYFGETPTTNSAGLSGNMNVDLKLVDIERVEVLRGPQGTAFGNSSLGGAVRTIPVAPNVDEVEGRVSASYSDTADSGGDNNMMQAVFNLPLAKGKFAIRGSAFQFKDNGYYNNVAGSDPAFRAAAVTPWGAEAFAVDQNEVGSSQYTGGRIAALFRASDDLKFTVTYLKQQTEIDGALITGTGGPAMTLQGGFNQAVLNVAPEHSVRGQAGPVADTDIDLASAVMEMNVGWGTVLATVSHIESETTNTTPYSWCCAPLPISALAPSDHRDTSGEVRFASQLDGSWQFLVGLYGEQLNDEYSSNYLWHGDPALNPLDRGVRELGDYFDKRELKQKAAFGEVSWEFAPRWTITGGMRAYDYERTGRVDTTSGAFFGAVPRTTITDANADGTTFRGNLKFKPTDEALLYASWSQGFRLGSPQPGLPAPCDADNDGLVDNSNLSIASTRSTKSDEVDNLELGAKFSLLDGRVTVTGDVYHMDWDGVPIRVNVGTCGSYTANAGAARSRGVELQASFRITPSFRVDIGGSKVDAKLTKDAPDLFVPASKGDRLPGSPEYNANLALEYEFGLLDYDALVRFDSIYVGSFYGDLQESPNNEAGGYVKADLTARVTIQNLAMDLFVRNLTNQDDYTFRYLGFESHGYRLRPRTVGLQLSYEF